jgi:hypothetical protein
MFLRQAAFTATARAGAKPDAAFEAESGSWHSQMQQETQKISQKITKNTKTDFLQKGKKATNRTVLEVG